MIIRYLTDETNDDNSIICHTETIIYSNKPPVSRTINQKQLPFLESDIKATFFSHSMFYNGRLFSHCASKCLLQKFNIHDLGYDEMPMELKERRNMPRNHPKFHSLKFIHYCKKWNDYD